MKMTIETDIHMNQPIRQMGEPLATARAAIIMIHGRGANAESILTLVPEIETAGFAYLAPQAAGNVWYPYPFMSPLEANEPALSSALNKVGRVAAQVQAADIPLEKTILLGFSQGACLTLEYAARNARRYGGVVGLSGGVIGPNDTPRDYAGSLMETPVFLGCSDVDFHIPLHRVQESTRIMRAIGGNVTERIYPGMDHIINHDEIAFVRSMMAALI
jgi:predicted esterase